VQRPWFETIFDERYPELFGPIEGNAEEEVEEILGFLRLPAGTAVEDLGCGRGRHAIPLARRGYRVTGVDISENMLRMACSRAEREGVRVEWVKEDMRTFCRHDAFDLCLSLFTSFGYFSDAENQKVLDNIGKSLKEGGALLLDLRNRLLQELSFVSPDFVHADPLVSRSPGPSTHPSDESSTRSYRSRIPHFPSAHRLPSPLYVLTWFRPASLAR